MYVVTIKLSKNPKHDPHNKVVGSCPFTSHCTDSTGEHHSTVVDSPEMVEAIRSEYKHVTRVERIY